MALDGPGIDDPLVEEGLARHRQGDLRGARKLYEKAADRNPSNADVHSLLGVTHHQLGNNKAAERAMRKAVDLEPENADFINNLGYIQRQLGKPEAAAERFSKALELNPEFVDAHANLGDIARERTEYQTAVDHYRRALKLDDAHARSLHGLGLCLVQEEGLSTGLRYLAKAAAIEPADELFTETIEMAATRETPPYLFGTLNDPDRIDAFRRAIARDALDIDQVLEIGTGSGLLALLAAKAGAKRVVTLESDGRSVGVAREIVNLNAMMDRVTVVHEGSTRYRPGPEMSGPADLLICEIFGPDLLGEDCLVSIADAHRRLLKPGGTVLPRGATIHGALVGGEWLSRLRRVDHVAGIDLSPLSRMASGAVLTRTSAVVSDWLSESVDLLSFDFTSAPDLLGEAEVSIPVSTGGDVDGLILWFTLDLGGGTTFTTDPRRGERHWPVVIHLFDRPIAASAETELRFRVSYARQFMFVDPIEAAD